MATEDKLLAMRIRRYLARKSADISLMEITCGKGMVTLTGELRSPRDLKGKLNLQDEMMEIVDLIRRVPGVKDVTNAVTLEGQSLRRSR